MSEFTFNIADYQPLSAAARLQRVCDRGPVAPSGFVVVSSNSESREREEEWLVRGPAVVDIQSIREASRTGHLLCHTGSCKRRGKILRFTNERHEQVVTMASRDRLQSDEDPDPTNSPTAA